MLKRMSIWRNFEKDCLPFLIIQAQLIRATLQNAWKQ